MAGLGRKIFTAGDVLTASDVQSYLQDQTVMNFAGTAARSSAVATPTTGMVSYRQDASNVEYYNGASWVGVGGLQLIKTQTIGSGVSSVAVTNAFSSTYDNYKIVVSGGVGSTSGGLRFSLTGSSASYFYQLNYSLYGGTSASSAGFGGSGDSSWDYCGYAHPSYQLMNLDLLSPNKTQFTVFNATYSSTGSTGSSSGYHGVATAYTGFTITATAGTLTGGTIAVYGYAK